MISAHAGSQLKSDKLTVWIESITFWKGWLGSFVYFSWVSQDDVWDSYCADRALQICLASWLVGGWVDGQLGGWGGSHTEAIQRKKERSLYPFYPFKAFVYQKKKHTFGAITYISEFVNTKGSSLWQMKNLFFIYFHVHLFFFRYNLLILKVISFRMITAGMNPCLFIMNAMLLKIPPVMPCYIWSVIFD